MLGVEAMYWGEKRVIMLRSESGNGTGLALLDGAFGSAEESFLGRENADQLLHLAVLQVSNAGTQCVCVCVCV